MKHSDNREPANEIQGLSSRFLISILHNLPLAILGITSKNELTPVNRTAYDLLGIESAGETPPSPIHDPKTRFHDITELFPDARDDGLLRAIDEVRERKTDRSDLRFWRDLPGRRRMFVRTLLVPLLSDDEKSPGKDDAKLFDIFMLIEDVTGQHEDHELREELESARDKQLKIQEELESARDEQLKIQEELEIAKEVQKSFLPDSNYRSDLVETFGITFPAKEVGGDYYECIRGQNRLHIVIADVAGKGISASIVMSSLATALQTFIDVEFDFPGIIPSLNKVVYDNTPDQMFISAFYGCLNEETREFIYCNAGHNHPILFRKGKVNRELETGGPVLGVLPDAGYELERLVLDEGDHILLYTDGVNEAMNAAEEEFGLTRLHDIIAGLEEPSSKQLVETIVEGIREFQGDAAQYDDMTLLSVKIRAVERS